MGEGVRLDVLSCVAMMVPKSSLQFTDANHSNTIRN